MIYQDIFKKIKEYQRIIIFRHQNPDGDAACSQLALAEYIKDNYPDKEVYRAGIDDYSSYSTYEDLNNDIFQDFLAIVLDTANVDRADDERFKSADFIIKIDHHPPIDQYGDLNYVDTKASATCQILADILFSENGIMSDKCCEYLLAGILTDTMNFTTTNTSSSTLSLAARLIEKGNLKISEISDNVFKKPLSEFKLVTEIRNHLQIDSGLGFLVLSQDDLDDIGCTWRQAKNQVAEFGNIEELKIWTIFIYNSDTSLYEGTLRSKRPYILNQLILKYNGGGHPNAVGVKGLDIDKVYELIEDLKLLIKEVKK